ncbi:MAG: hypothetical protein QOJ81_1263 [Chloroflexota bacterium]|jgi:hypothetical protein|nr:hypothetical protein [Chloroflexota bacterium]
MFTRVGALRLLVVIGAISLFLTTAIAPAAAAGDLPGTFMGDAYGNRANAKAGELSTKLGRAAYQPCPCHGTGGAVHSNAVDNVDGGKAYKAGHIENTAQAMKQTGMKAFVQTTSTVTNIRALDGLITVQSMRAVATTKASTSSITSNHDGSAITGLKINGNSVTVNPGQRIDLPGFGYVVFYDVRRLGDGTSFGGIRVDMMRIVITRANSLDIPVGSEIISTHARAGYSRNESASVLGAAAWGSTATSSSADVRNAFGRSAPVYLGCFARGTASGSNRVHEATYPQTLYTGLIVNRVHGEISSSLALASANSRIETVNLFNGLVTAEVVKGVATAYVDGSGGHVNFDGSRFLNLQVNGQAFGDNVAPNTQVALPGIGTMTLFRTSSSHDANEAHAQIDMIVINVTQLTPQGIPAGTEIKIAHASADSQP